MLTDYLLTGNGALGTLPDFALEALAAEALQKLAAFERGDGHRKLLEQFEELQQLHIQDRDRLERELAEISN